MGTRKVAAGVDPEDAAVLDLFEPRLREWWLDRFGDVDGPLFTPPQREAIPNIHAGRNTLVCAPTGSGKCLKPDTPLVITENGEASVIRAGELLGHRKEKLSDVDKDGELYDSDIHAFSLSEGEITERESFIYSETYNGQLHRLKTVYGREVEVTPDHPLLVETSDGHEWRRAEEISEGDRIGVPKQIELPTQELNLDVVGAINALRARFSMVITKEESDRVISKLINSSHTKSVGETDLRKALALADLSMRDVSEQLSIGISSVFNIVTQQIEYKSEELLNLIRTEINPLNEREVLVVTENGRKSRFTYPEKIDQEIASFCAFVLAEGYIGDYDSGAHLAISQKNRTGLLLQALTIAEKRFNVRFKRRNEKDFIIADSPFTIFVSELLGLDSGRGRQVRLPDWILNAPTDIKRQFISTFVSLEGEVRKNEIRVIQANEIKIEQLNYLFLSFGIQPARRVATKFATNTEDQTRREYYELTIGGKPDLRKFLKEFDVEHQNIEDVELYADGGTSGALTDKHKFNYQDIRSLSKHYEDEEAFDGALGNVYEVVRRTGTITDRALTTLAGIVDSLPDDETTQGLAQKIDEIQGRNISWLEVTEKNTVQYEGEIIDLSVPDTHNFVGGRGGLYLHNTLASFTGIINELYRRERDEGLDNTVYCLYVSPLRSLANDIHRNLEVPLSAITDDDVEIRHAIRHGDTDEYDRQRMLEETPHILNTTPETLAILLCAPRFREKLASVEYVIVDEIHSLAADKRGTHLSVSLERLENLTEASPTRIGCSATVEPLDTMADFLVGRHGPEGPARDCTVVDTRFVRDYDLELVCPTDDLVGTPRHELTDRFYARLHEWIQSHDTTLVFTNTRSGAERVLYRLRERYPDAYDDDNAGCHHGSMAAGVRQDVEERLKAGAIDVVTTSTSLELGIDMPTLDLVVQVGSPKSVASLLQRVGRAGHAPGDTVTGRVVALDRDELVECAVMVRKAAEGFVDRVFVPERAQDVAAQHVYGMAINGIEREADVRATLRRASPYRDYTDDEWEQLMRYLTADYPGLEARNVYAKVWRDTNDPPGGEHHYEEHDPGARLVGRRGRLARAIYLQNVGTIPDSFDCAVLTRGGGEWVGQLDEGYLDTLEPGDVLLLGGERYEYRYRRGSNVYVEPTDERPTVPSWYSERLPLSYDLGRAVLAFQGELRDRLAAGGVPAVREWLRAFPIDENAVYALATLFDEQVRYAGPESVATPDRLVVERELDHKDYRRRYYVHSTYGRAFNDGLSRVVAHQCAKRTDANVGVAVADHGFTLSMPLNRKVDPAAIIRDLDPDGVRAELREALSETDLLQRYFRINATRSLMILKRYKGHEKSAAKQQVSSEMLLGFAEALEDFAVLEETYRELLEDKLNLAGLREVLGGVQAGDLAVESVDVPSPSPRAFGLATLSASDVVLAEDESEALRRFHERVIREIEGEEAGVAAGGGN